jgi:hypothetical protein
MSAAACMQPANALLYNRFCIRVVQHGLLGTLSPQKKCPKYQKNVCRKVHISLIITPEQIELNRVKH